MRRIVLPITLAAAGVALGIVPRLAAAQQSGVILVSGMGGKCLDAEGGRAENGTRLIGYPCNGNWNEQFTFMPDGTIRLRGKCVDDMGGLGRDGDQIELWDCNGGANQKWRYEGHRLVGVGSKKCIDLKGGDGFWVPMIWNQPAILWPCSGAQNQSWYKGVRMAASRISGARVVNAGQRIDLRPVAGVIAAGGGNVIAAGGGNVIAAGGGNVIAAGGGNVIAPTSGN